MVPGRVSHQARPGHPFSGEFMVFPGGEFVVGIDIQAMLEKQRAIVAKRESLACSVEWGGEYVSVELFKLRADEWRDLIDAHPPRPDTSDTIFNQTTMGGAYPAGSVLVGGSEVSQDEWAEIFGGLEPMSQENVYAILYALHVLEPMKRLVSLGKAAQGGTSGSPANRASRRAASRGGSRQK